MRLKTFFRTGLLSVLIFLLPQSCERSETGPSVPEGGDFEICFSLAGMQASAELTRSLSSRSGENEDTGDDDDYEQQIANVEETRIESLALFLISSDAQPHIVGYRIFIYNRADGKKYIYKNVAGLSGNPDIPLSSVGGAHSGLTDNDDETTEDNPSGFNGFVGGVDGDREMVKVSFSYDHPLHGPLERLKVGEYKIAAIANFDESEGLILGMRISEHIAEMISYWQRHKDEAGFKGIPAGRVADEEARGGWFEGFKALLDARIVLSDATVSNYVNADHSPSREDRISSPSQIRPANQKLIATYTGNHNNNNNNNNYQLDLSLDRILTRTTILLDNQTNFNLRVSDLTLDSDYGQAANFLFRNLDDNDIAYFHPENWLGPVKLDSDRAIVPYDPARIYSPRDNHTLFDALIYGGGTLSTQREMSLKISFPEMLRFEYSTNQNRLSHAAVMSKISSMEVGETALILLQGNGGPFMRTFGDEIPKGDVSVTTIVQAAAKVSQGEQGLPYIWRIKKINSDGDLIFCNAETGKWIKITGTNDQGNVPVGFTENESEASEFRAGCYPESFINGKVYGDNTAFTNNSFTTEPVFLHFLSQNNNKYFSTCIKWSDGNSHFNVYEVSYVEEEMSQIVDFQMEAYDKKTTSFAPLHTVRRNQHIIVSLRVRYNEQSQTILVNGYTGSDGSKWEESTNDVTFD